MDFLLTGHEFEHAVQTVIQVFYPNEGYKKLGSRPEGGLYIESRYEDGVYDALVYKDGVVIESGSAELTGWDKRAHTRAAAKAIFTALTEVTGYRPPWGTLTGVRPVKVVKELSAYLVREDKLRLCKEVAGAEARFLASSGVDDIGIYIGIPFCPTVCAYCSFSSYPLKTHGAKREEYLEALFKEMAYLGEIAAHRHVSSIYIGGGTPTSLEPDMLRRLMGKARDLFAGSYELTVEAGRPDSICAEKLAVLKEYGTTRLAINPQTMSGETLSRIGRLHDPQDFIRAYTLARDMGFNNINCDVILGLPGETRGDTEHTFAELTRLSPESVTVHTLSIKRASDLNNSIGRYGIMNGKNAGQNEGIGKIEEMLGIAEASCRAMGLFPYYLYRQKNMVGNFENVGYAKPGYESVYNHITMTEMRGIYAAGAGAVTKAVYHNPWFIKRAFNVRNLDEYITRVDEMIERKMSLQ